MNPPVHDNALDALERARQAQERHDGRIDVQLRIWTAQERLDAELADTLEHHRLLHPLPDPLQSSR